MMTPQQIRDAIAADAEMSAWAVLRQDGLIAAKLSIGRVRLKPTIITERGVRQNLSIVEGANLLKLLRDVNAASSAPAWLTAVLTGVGVPADQQWAYFDAMQCGWPWLRSEGLDMGSTAVRSMLDLIAAGNPTLASACVTLKKLGEEPDPVSTNQVSDALNGA